MADPPAPSRLFRRFRIGKEESLEVGIGGVGGSAEVGVKRSEACWVWACSGCTSHPTFRSLVVSSRPTWCSGGRTTPSPPTTCRSRHRLTGYTCGTSGELFLNFLVTIRPSSYQLFFWILFYTWRPRKLFSCWSSILEVLRFFWLLPPPPSSSTNGYFWKIADFNWYCVQLNSFVGCSFPNFIVWNLVFVILLLRCLSLTNSYLI